MQTTLVIRDVPAETTDETFSTHFNTAVSASLKRDKKGVCRGFGFVVFDTKEEADTVLAEINQEGAAATPFGILRAELSNGGKKKKEHQKKTKKTKKTDSEENQRDLGRFRSRRGPSVRKHPNSTTRSDLNSHVPTHFYRDRKKV